MFGRVFWTRMHAVQFSFPKKKEMNFMKRQFWLWGREEVIGLYTFGSVHCSSWSGVKSPKQEQHGSNAHHRETQRERGFHCVYQYSDSLCQWFSEPVLCSLTTEGQYFDGGWCNLNSGWHFEVIFLIPILPIWPLRLLWGLELFVSWICLVWTIFQRLLPVLNCCI